jgi:uncharacterized protein YbjT (DUF2867 family)
MNRKVVVVDGLGETGDRVFERLVARGVHACAVSQSSDPNFDWLDQSTWPRALHGATAAYVAYRADPSAPWADDHVGTLAHVAAEVGVEHMVLLSGRGLEGVCSEERLRRAPLDHTILRAPWSVRNFNDVIARNAALPAGDVRERSVSLDDIADAAVEALCNPVHIGRTYEIIGPRSLGFANSLSRVEKASGRERNRRAPVDSAQVQSSRH